MGNKMKRFSAFLLVLSSVVACALPIHFGKPSGGLVSGSAALFDIDKGVTKNGSNQVTVWADQSGNGNDATSVTATAPIWNATALNGGPALTQDGATTKQFMVLTTPLSGSVFSAYVVGYANSATSQAFIGSTNGTNVGVLLGIVDSTTLEIYDGNLFWRDWTHSFTLGTPYVWSVRVNGNSNTAVASKNGAALTVSGTSAGVMNFLNGGNGPVKTLGARGTAIWNLNGGYSDAIIYQSVLTDPQDAANIAYLKAKRGIP
jgi:hypothetical protein